MQLWSRILPSSLFLAAGIFAGDIQADSACAWIYPQHPSNTPPRCETFTFPPRTSDAPFTLKDMSFGIPLHEALKTPGSLQGAPGALSPGLRLTAEFRRWGLRNVAFHLSRMHEFLRNRLGRAFDSRPIQVMLVSRPAAMGSLSRSEIHLGHHAELKSEVIYHEYAHHVIEWERPGLLENRDRFRDRVKGASAHSIIEAWANHLAFALDGEPRFSEYPAVLDGMLHTSYSVDTACTLTACDQWVFHRGFEFPHVIAFGAMLWDLHREAGRDESVTLLLDSLAHLDLSRPVDLIQAVSGLIRADEARVGRFSRLIRDSSRHRLGVSL